MTALPIPEIAPKIDLEAHRKLLVSAGDILAGRDSLRIADGAIFVYRHPSYNDLLYCPQLGQTNFGTIQFVNGHFEVNGTVIHAIADANEALTFLTSLMHLVSVHRRDLSMHANRRMERNTRTYASPSGVEGHLLKEYDQLLEELKHEYYYQRSRLDEK